VDATVAGGGGADALAVSVTALTTLDPGGTMHVLEDGGQGNDAVTGDFAPHVLAGGALIADVLGGGGQDSLIGLLHPAVEGAPAGGTTAPGSFTGSFDGGDGNDAMIALIQPSISDGAIIVHYFGGDDSIDASVDLPASTSSPGPVNVTVDGGRGSDHLSLLVRGAERLPPDDRFFLDGGAGEDFAVVSAGVRVRDAEHVVTV
jgi:hypothetical protein